MAKHKKGMPIIKDQDYTNQHFGHWTVLNKVNDVTWLCRCDCGKEQNVTIYNLTNEKTHSCQECSYKEQKGKIKPTAQCHQDLTGQRFGKWIALRKEDDCSHLCKCDCGAERKINTYLLLNKTIRCQECIIEERKKSGTFLTHKDYTNQKFNHWTILSKVTYRKWLCRCDCGREQNVMLYNILNGTSKQCQSCGNKGERKAYTKRPAKIQERLSTEMLTILTEKRDKLNERIKKLNDEAELLDSFIIQLEKKKNE